MQYRRTNLQQQSRQEPMIFHINNDIFEQLHKKQHRNRHRVVQKHVCNYSSIHATDPQASTNCRACMNEQAIDFEDHRSSDDIA